MIMVLFPHCIEKQQVVITKLFTNSEWMNEMNENQRILSVFK